MPGTGAAERARSARVTAPHTARVLLCCEAGSGRGHVTTLAAVARALAPDYRSQAVLARLDHADVLAPRCDRVDPGLHLRRLKRAPVPRTLSAASWLQIRGFGDPDTLRARFEWCCAALQAIRPALVVGDYAPTMLMAARTMGITCVATGAAFGLPPATLDHLPELLMPQDAAAHGTALPDDAPPVDEAALCSTINHTLAPLGLPPLHRLAQVHDCTMALPRGVSLWDPYAAWRDRPLLLPLDRLPPLADGAQGTVFIYLSGADLREEAIRTALTRLPFAACLVAPGLSAEAAAQLSANPLLTISPAPLPPDLIAAQSRAVLCAGQAGTLALAVLAGLPVLALPMQHEQLSNALRAAAQLSACRVLPRTARSPEAIIDTLAALLARPASAKTAREDALRLRPAYAETAMESYRRLLRPLAGRAGNAPLPPPGDAG